MEHVEGNFLMQLVNEPTGEVPRLTCSLETEGLVGDGGVGSHFAPSDCTLMEFLMPGKIRKGGWQNLYRGLAEGRLWTLRDAG